MRFNEYQQAQSNFANPTLPGQGKPAYLPPRRSGGWLWLIVALIILAVGGTFLGSVYIKVQQRRAAVDAIMARAQAVAPEGIVEDSGLISQLAGKIQGQSSTPATSSAPNVAPAAGNQKSAKRLQIEKMDRPKLGNASSSLVIVEFADFKCPVCLEEFPAIRAFVAKYPKEVLFIFRNYPIKGDVSDLLALASYCANEQGKFWPFHDRIFLSQETISTLDDIKSAALMSGLDWKKMNACISVDKYRSKITEDSADAIDLGVMGTPTFFINGNKLQGAVPLEQWEQIINKYRELISQ